MLMKCVSSLEQCLALRKSLLSGFISCFRADRQQVFVGTHFMLNAVGSQSERFSSRPEIFLPILIYCCVTNYLQTQSRKQPSIAFAHKSTIWVKLGGDDPSLLPRAGAWSSVVVAPLRGLGCVTAGWLTEREPSRSCPTLMMGPPRLPGIRSHHTPSVEAVSKPLPPPDSRERDKTGKFWKSLWDGNYHRSRFEKENPFLRHEGSGLDGFVQVTRPPPHTPLHRWEN